MAVSDTQASQVLAKSARHCCICRQFNPLLIQVHHIIPKEKGGKDTLDNLVPICITCHASIHTSPGMTRKFTEKELRLCRQAVYELVEEGKLPAKIPLTSNELQSLSATLTERLRKESIKFSNLPQISIDILVAAIGEDAPIKVANNESIKYVSVGNQRFFTTKCEDGDYPDELIALLDCRFVRRSDNNLIVTEDGRNRVLEITQHATSFTLKKVKCMNCGLHFSICSDSENLHQASNIFCPECGQHDGRFILWMQKQIGFIFEHVPGRANIYEIGKAKKK